MFQVFVLNMCYDVPVKIFSFFLLLLSLYLCLPQASRLFRFFFTDRPVEPYVYFDWISGRKLKRARLVLHGLFVVGVGFLAWQQLSQTGGPLNNTPKLTIEGHYTVAKASRQVDSVEWTNVGLRSWFDQLLFAGINEDKGTRTRWNTIVNDSLKTLTLKSMSPEDSTVVATLQYTQPDTNQLYLQGLWGADSFYLHLKRRPKRDFLLVKRGFHWINNEPFNR